MSRKDLDQIQAHLKVAIQNHQLLVAKMKHDPQNGDLQRQLHDLQSQITNLSDKQKSIVQQLRKELVSKQAAAIMTSIAESKQQSKALSEQNQPAAATASPRKSHSVLANVNNNINKPQQGSRSRPGSRPASRSGSPLIRVPQFTTNKPAIIQSGGKGSALRSTPCTSPTAAGRKPSDSDVNSYIKKTSLEKKELPPEERKKLEYMASLDLITPETLKELQSRRSERKRRSTANPQFAYGHFEPVERKRRVVSYLAAVAPVQGIRKRGRPRKHLSPLATPTRGEFSYARAPAPFSPRMVPPKVAIVKGVPQQPTSQTEPPSADVVDRMENDIHEDFCAECHRSGELLMCDTCSLVYHLNCLDPPLTSIPQGLWSCPKCKALGKQSGDNNNWPGTLALVHSYITHKAAKEDDKKRLQRKVQELKLEQAELENKAKTLSETIKKQLQQKADMLNQNHSAQQSMDQLKSLISLFHSS